MFDAVQVGRKSCQVKLWYNQFNLYKPSDVVPCIDNGRATYSIAVREGGYLNIKQGRLKSWTKTPLHRYVVDKYGSKFTSSDSYFFKH